MRSKHTHGAGKYFVIYIHWLIATEEALTSQNETYTTEHTTRQQRFHTSMLTHLSLALLIYFSKSS